jgi:adenylate cyclase
VISAIPRLGYTSAMSGGLQRRLAAIVSADVVGYSRLVEQDEAGTLAALKAHRAELIDPLIAAHGGRIVKVMGDGLLLEFPSVVGAVECQIEFQEGMAARNSAVPEDRRLVYRVGIHLGDIAIDGEDIHGDGVNIAARLQEAGNPGGIMLSGIAYESLGSLIDASFEDGGRKSFKNIARQVNVWRWAPMQAKTSAGTWAEAGAMAAKTLFDKPAIAVLPFINMSSDHEQEYFSDGLTEDIITALTRWRSFPVIARNSCFAYKNKAFDIKQTGRELGARYLLEGSVRRGGARVRITAQLIDGTDGHHLWAEKYDRELDDIFEVQDDIVQRIVALVAPELDRAELKRSTSKQPQDLDAWDMRLRGMASIRERTAEGNATARDSFNRAIAIRPDYADAHAGLAMSYNQDILVEAAEDRMATATLAMEAAWKAIECDKALSWAHHELSTAYQWLNRLDDALDEARIAVDLNPNDAYTLHALGNKSDLAGDPDGIGFMEKAQKLNPEDARLHTHLTFLARAYANVDNHGAAVERARQAIRRRPDYAPAHYILAIELGRLGEPEEARAVLAKCDELNPGFVQSRRTWRPYTDPAGNERLRESLRRIEK